MVTLIDTIINWCGTTTTYFLTCLTYFYIYFCLLPQKKKKERKNIFLGSLSYSLMLSISFFSLLVMNRFIIFSCSSFSTLLLTFLVIFETNNFMMVSEFFCWWACFVSVFFFVFTWEYMKLCLYYFFRMHELMYEILYVWMYEIILFFIFLSENAWNFIFHFFKGECMDECSRLFVMFEWEYTRLCFFVFLWECLYKCMRFHLSFMFEWECMYKCIILYENARTNAIKPIFLHKDECIRLYENACMHETLWECMRFYFHHLFSFSFVIQSQLFSLPSLNSFISKFVLENEGCCKS